MLGRGKDRITAGGEAGGTVAGTVDGRHGTPLHRRLPTPTFGIVW